MLDVQATPGLRKFGNTDMLLSPLGLGCWQFSKARGLVGGFWPKLDNALVNDIVRVSLEGGINWFDTAEIYGGGESEQVLAESLAAAGSLAIEAHIATKWWPGFRTAGNIPRTIDERLRRLGGYPIDLYMIHQPFSFSSVGGEMRQMARLAEQGKIRYVGVSNFNAKRMREADRVLREHGLRLASNQMKYSMLDRRIERNGVLETAQELGIAIIAYSPLEQGILSGKFHGNPELIRKAPGPRRLMKGFKPQGLQQTKPLIDVLERFATRYQASPTQIALNWVIHAHGDSVFAIPGASKLHHAQENVRAMGFRLSESEIDELNEMSARVALK
ncbi:aldo/keto reductase [Cohnella lupini]|uniref:Aryl-alcohol dehydrogenase-like predicted oxidoreductase n=1 Tax=Cohnella lupini TaxID=1294267 RepID=A0A3D9ISB8_9BACL|nr:aldo/keto reductase [Cohnella lupini]RED64654.1 aryl-alcohol dehydrogenase-like predicted oxidoreductase [Cohnella lupini]